VADNPEYFCDKSVSVHISDEGTTNSEGFSVVDNHALSEFEMSLQKSSPSDLISDFQDHSSVVQYHVDFPEGHVSASPFESRYPSCLSSDVDLPVLTEATHSNAENCANSVAGVTCQSEMLWVSDEEVEPSTAEVVVAGVAISTGALEHAVVAGAVELYKRDGSGGLDSGGNDRELETSDICASCDKARGAAIFVSQTPTTSTVTAVEASGEKLAAVSEEDVREVALRTGHAAPTAVYDAAAAETSVNSVVDADCASCKCTNTDVEKLSDGGCDGNPSDVGDENSVGDRRTGGVCRIIPVTTVQRASSASDTTAVTAVGRQDDVDDRNPDDGGDEELTSESACCGDDELLVLVNFRITSDRYEDSGVASETRESCSRMIVRKSDIHPNVIPRFPTPFDWMHTCSTENRQFYLVRRKATNVVLGDDSCTMATADGGKVPDLGEISQYSLRDIRDAAAHRISQVAERSVMKTMKIMKQVVVTKTETNFSDDDEDDDAGGGGACRSSRIFTEVTDGSCTDVDYDKQNGAWITENVRESSVETEGTTDSYATDMGEYETAGYFSASENFEHEDMRHSFSSGLEEMDTTLVLGDDGITVMWKDDFDKHFVEARGGDVREMIENETPAEFSDDEKKRPISGQLQRTGEVGIGHIFDVHPSVELQEIETYEVTEADPVDVLSVVPVFSETEFGNRVAVETVKNHVQVTKADDEQISEDGRLRDMSAIDTVEVTPAVVVSEVSAAVVASKGVSVVQDEGVQVGDDAAVQKADDVADADSHLGEIKVAADEVLEALSNVEQIDVESLTLIEDGSELHNIALKSKGLKTYVEPVAHRGVIFENASSVSSDLTEIEITSISADVVPSSAYANVMQLEQGVELHVCAMTFDLAADLTAFDDAVSEVDVAGRCLLQPHVVSDETNSSVITEQSSTFVEPHLTVATQDDACAEIGDTESCTVSSVTLYDEADRALDVAVISERAQTHASVSVDDGVAEDKLVTEADIAGTVSFDTVDHDHAVGAVVRSDRVESHAEAIPTFEAENVSDVEEPAVLTDSTEIQSDETSHTVWAQSRIETCVQTSVTADSTDTVEHHSVTEFNDIETCTVIPNIVADETQSVADTVFSWPKIESSVDVKTDNRNEADGQSSHLDSSGDTGVSVVDVTDIHSAEDEGDTVVGEAETGDATRVDTAVAETQALIDQYNSSTSDAQMSTFPIDCMCAETQTVDYEAGYTVTVEAETSTIPIDMEEAPTIIGRDDTSSSDAQTSTSLLDFVFVASHTVEYEADPMTVEAETCTTPVYTTVEGTRTLLGDIGTATAEAQTSTTPVDLVMVDTQTVWTDESDDGDLFPLVPAHSVVAARDHVNVGSDVRYDIGNTSAVDDVSDNANELEVTNSSLELDDFMSLSSSEASFVDANEELEDVLGSDGSLKTDSADVGVSDDKCTQILDSEYTDSADQNLSFQNIDEITDDSGAPQVEMFDHPSDTQVSSPSSPVPVCVEQRPVGPDVSQVISVVSGCAEWCWSTFAMLHCFRFITSSVCFPVYYACQLLTSVVGHVFFLKYCSWNISVFWMLFSEHACSLFMFFCCAFLLPRPVNEHVSIMSPAC